MRTTVDLPPAVHRRARELAARRGTSLSSVVAELVVRGLGQLDDPVVVSTDPVSGFPVITIGCPVTADDVARAIDDE